MSEIEIWKDIPEYENLYQVSNFGNVKSLNYNRLGKARILKPSKDNDGYLHVILFKGGKKKSFTIHKLVCLVFLENPYNLPIVNHKNEIKNDNRVENLEWCTYEYNNNYGSKKQKMSEAMKGKPRYKYRKPILQYTKEGEFIREWDSTKSASIKLNIDKSNLCNCCKNKVKSAGGYIWRYKE